MLSLIAALALVQSPALDVPLVSAEPVISLNRRSAMSFELDALESQRISSVWIYVFGIIASVGPLVSAGALFEDLTNGGLCLPGCGDNELSGTKSIIAGAGLVGTLVGLVGLGIAVGLRSRGSARISELERALAAQPAPRRDVLFVPKRAPPPPALGFQLELAQF